MEPRGIEPRFAECDSAVIPLDHGPGLEFPIHRIVVPSRGGSSVARERAGPRAGSRAVARADVPRWRGESLLEATRLWGTISGMKSLTEYLSFSVPSRVGFVNITQQCE